MFFVDLVNFVESGQLECFEKSQQIKFIVIIIIIERPIKHHHLWIDAL